MPIEIKSVRNAINLTTDDLMPKGSLIGKTKFLTLDMVRVPRKEVRGLSVIVVLFKTLVNLKTIFHINYY